jgi:hypothetical protein
MTVCGKCGAESLPASNFCGKCGTPLAKDKRREKVTGRVVALDRGLEDTLPYLLSLLGIVEGDDPTAQIDGQIKKRRTHEAIKRILLRESLNQPLMVIFEDLHWMDAESEALLNLLADSIGTAKILLLVNYRPEYSHSWGSKSYYLQLRLDPLGRESAEELLTSLLGDDENLVPLKRRLIIEKTEGTPFFMEETVQMLFDQGGLERNGSTKLTRPLAELKIPPTVQAILASRIDRLPPDQKELLQTLAVIGREFPLSLVREVTKQSDDDLNRMLNDLQLGEFINEQPAVGDIEYLFKHALTQEVVYNSILAERRKMLHQFTGEAIERLYAGRLEDYLDDVAHHYSRSANVPKAVNYLHLVARQCVTRTAHLQALTYLDRELELLTALPDNPERARRELAIQIARGESLYPTQGWSPATGSTFSRARELCERVGERAQMFGILIGLRLFHSFRLEMQTARQITEQILALANELDTPAMVARAHAAVGLNRLWMGELVSAREHIELAMGSADSIQTGFAYDWDYSIMAVAISHLAWDLAILGFPDQAKKVSQRLMLAVQSMSRPLPLALALFYTSLLDQTLGDAQRAEDHSASALAIAADYGLPHVLSLASAVHGWSLSFRGEVDVGIAEMRRGIAEANSNEMRAPTFLYIPLAQTYVATEQTIDALDIVNEALELAQRTGQRLHEAELFRLKGELLLRPSRDASNAEACFLRAISTARAQSAKWWELRSSVSLARLLVKQGHRQEAAAMLTEIYNWFTEGFDTRDLQEAKQLLNELDQES